MAKTTVKEAFAVYYRNEFRRADDCLDAVIKVLDWEGPDSQRIDDILDILIRYYNRDTE
jgi:hypothetical protein